MTPLDEVTIQEKMINYKSDSVSQDEQIPFPDVGPWQQNNVQPFVR